MDDISIVKKRIQETFYGRWDLTKCTGCTCTVKEDEYIQFSVSTTHFMIPVCKDCLHSATLTITPVYEKDAIKGESYEFPVSNHNKKLGGFLMDNIGVFASSDKMVEKRIQEVFNEKWDLTKCVKCLNTVKKDEYLKFHAPNKVYEIPMCNKCLEAGTIN